MEYMHACLYQLFEFDCMNVFTSQLYYSCADIDECEEAARNDSSICVENSDCINTLGSYRCACFEGYLLVNGSCQRE